MDPSRNPYAPGARMPRPVLAGREALLERAAIALDRVRAGKPARGLVFYGQRGVGKTVLLNRIRLDAEARGIASVQIEACEYRSLPSLLGPALRPALLRTSRREAPKDDALRGLRALGSFASSRKVRFRDIDATFDADPETGLADSGDLESDLPELLQAIGEAARELDTALVLFVDELQSVPSAHLASLISALHSISQVQLPVTLVAAGLPRSVGRVGDARPYAERLFEFVPVDPLADDAARSAQVVPASR